MRGQCQHEYAPYLLPSLLALYDTLLDDDDEVREIGASGVSIILGRSLVPLAAATEFAGWLSRTYADSELLHKTIIRRITGVHYHFLEYGLQQPDTRPVAEQLHEASKEDNALFMEEKQNLFIDEVREMKTWAAALRSAGGALGKQTAARLLPWVLDGLARLTEAAKKDDGAFGWTAKPGVFTLCMSVILGARALISRCRSEGKGESAEAITRLGEVALVTEDEIDVCARLTAAVISLEAAGIRGKMHEVLLEELRGQNAFVIGRKDNGASGV